MKIAIFFSNALVAKLTKYFTGCYAYHIAFINERTGTIYEMDARRRMRKMYLQTLDAKVAKGRIRLYDLPVMVNDVHFEDYLTSQTMFDPARYGVLDYLHFALRSFRRLVGLPLKNYAGEICSEMVNEDLITFGWESPWPKKGPPPSPCHFYQLLEKGRVQE